MRQFKSGTEEETRRAKREEEEIEKQRECVNESKRCSKRRKYSKAEFLYSGNLKIGMTNNLISLSSEYDVPFCFLFFLPVHYFFPEMTNTTGGVLLALLFILSASVPCFSVYNSGECFFNTKGTVQCT